MSAISAAAMRVKTMADGSLRIEVEVEPADAQAAFALFGRPGAPMALAALVEGHAAVKEPEAEKPKGGERARWVAMRCAEPEFQRWLLRTFPEYGGVSWASLQEGAAQMVRDICGVSSRAELDADTYVAQQFDTLIRKAWQEHRGVPA